MIKKMIEFVTGSIQEKKDYKLYKKRIAKLPDDYKKTMLGIQTYIWNFGSSDGKELYDILEMLEIAVADGRKVEEIIGKDIGAFCDGIIQANPEKNWITGYKKKVISNIEKKINKQ